MTHCYKCCPTRQPFTFRQVNRAPPAPFNSVMKFGKTLTVLAATAAGLCAHAQTEVLKSHAPGLKSPSPADLRSLLKQGAQNVGITPRRLSAEERAALRRQLSQPARREGKRS